MAGKRLAPRRSPQQTGASSVEFALVVPIFLLVVFGIMYFGLIFAQSLALGNAARQGARAAIVDDGTTCGAVVTQVRNAAQTIGLQNTSGVTVDVSRRDPATNALTPLCSTATNTVVPCKDQAVGTNIYIKATNPSTMKFPFMPSQPIKARGEGEFRCEFK